MSRVFQMWIYSVDVTSQYIPKYYRSNWRLNINVYFSSRREFTKIFVKNIGHNVTIVRGHGTSGKFVAYQRDKWSANFFFKHLNNILTYGRPFYEINISIHGVIILTRINYRVIKYEKRSNKRKRFKFFFNRFYSYYVFYILAITLYKKSFENFLFLPDSDIIEDNNNFYMIHVVPSQQYD